MNTHAPVMVERQTDPRVETILKHRHGPGVLVIALPMRVVYANRQAWEYTQRLEEHGGPNGERGPLPTPIMRLCMEIQEALQSRNGSTDPSQFEINRLVGLGERPVLLRGFGVPGYNGHQSMLVMILLEEVGRRQRAVMEVGPRFQLTVREKSVVEHLAKGLTNKEIAALMGIAEPTVKDHIKRIMQKTRSRTRTEILANLLVPLDQIA